MTDTYIVRTYESEVQVTADHHRFEGNDTERVLLFLVAGKPVAVFNTWSYFVKKNES